MTRRIVVTDHAFGNVDAERAVAAEIGASFAVHQCRTEAETITAVRGADAVLVNFAPMTAAALQALAPAAIVVRYGIGYDNVDVDAARAAGIAVANVPDYGSETVADHAVAALLSLLRRLPVYDGLIRDQGWCQPPDVGPLPALADTTVGLIGTGRIGLAVARRLQAFGTRVLAHDPYADPRIDEVVTRVELDDLLTTSDAISLHCPLVPETAHLIDHRALGRLRPGAVLVNTSRGGLVDTAALTDALSDGRLAGAALDVFEPEPLPADSPLRTQAGVILTPHAAFYSTASVRALQQLAADEVRRALTGAELRSRVA
ncbi:C-terminal binding protein [Microlunatus soli]|uniref:D-3-phosphoglycerate dehydrogenase n=1 Tax=Microlunatus soli TaxID=630515 RepID=A0A1H1XK39_9ACTN|nr:C-terminal binding protein [Microlunatus soli]SDT09597.1 D-3-phosphoglycerate dehydrogenase [Microlunatus soli]